jgi:hypothetical protein
MNLASNVNALSQIRNLISVGREEKRVKEGPRLLLVTGKGNSERGDVDGASSSARSLGVGLGHCCFLLRGVAVDTDAGPGFSLASRYRRMDFRVGHLFSGGKCFRFLSSAFIRCSIMISRLSCHVLLCRMVRGRGLKDSLLSSSSKAILAQMSSKIVNVGAIYIASVCTRLVS